MTEYASITIDGMTSLVSSLKVARHRLTAGVDPLRARMAAAGVSTARFADIDRIVDDIDRWLPELQRRLNLAVALAGESSASIRLVESPFSTPDEAADHGRELARRLLGRVELGEQMLDELTERLRPHVNDPDVMAGFYAELGPRLIERLPGLIDATGSPDGGSHLALLSTGLGTALDSPYHRADLDAVRRSFTHKPSNVDQAWDRLAMLQVGQFPAGWLARVLRANALDDFDSEDWVAAEHTAVGLPRLGLSSDVLVLAFSALGNDPAVARLVFDDPRGLSLSGYVDRVYTTDSVYRADIAAAFGRAVEGVLDTRSAPREPDATTARLAFEFIEASAEHSDVPWGIKDSLARIAVSYVHEVVAGAFSDDGEINGDRKSSMRRPYDFPQGSTLRPTFYLNPRVTSRFIGSFQDQTEPSAAFDEVVGKLLQTELDTAIGADQSDGGTRTQAVMRLFGGISTLHYFARREHAADFDAQQQRHRAALVELLNGGLSVVSLSGFWQALYWAGQIPADELLNSWVTSGQDAEDKVVAEHLRAEELRWYLTVESLIANGVAADAMPTAPEQLLENGRLRPMVEIFADDDLRRRLYRWVNETPELNDAADSAHEAWKAGTQGPRAVAKSSASLAK